MFLKCVRRDFYFWPWRSSRNRIYTSILTTRKSDTRQRAAQDRNPWEERNKWTLRWPSLLPRGGFQAAVQGGRNQRQSPAVSLSWGDRDRGREGAEIGKTKTACLWGGDLEKEDCTESSRDLRRDLLESLPKFGSVLVRRSQEKNLHKAVGWIPRAHTRLRLSGKVTQ